MKKVLVNWVLSAVCIYILSMLFRGIYVADFGAALVAALVLGLINAFIKPVIFILSLPVTVVTLGLFSVVINALMLMLASSLAPGFVVSGFGTALLAAVVLSVLNLIFVKDDKHSH